MAFCAGFRPYMASVFSFRLCAGDYRHQAALDDLRVAAIRLGHLVALVRAGALSNADTSSSAPNAEQPEYRPQIVMASVLPADERAIVGA